ncbi:hypothetical protein KIN20_029743 [Parelaphostrongylus tenuis]|uniref:Peptidase M12A domain-containing protein n=1 Tax=Parelaphostrongylus tenuis TaxID=148309 RepID=A0AAD5WFX7_PARTN|nr:hypothetical protein KIN20_015238 [Parelaphostrongylus tenuis]KAJ1368585.1 hypothetical protein KIN20_029743 [Parelaphostrongylus tenuis]
MAASSLIRQLLSYVYIVGLALARGRVINIFNGEKGDLAQYHRARRSITDGKFHNAIFNNSQNKWNLKDPNGYTVIPYVISGQYGVMHLMSVVKREGMYSCWKRTKTDREESQFDIIPSTKSTMYDIPYDYKSLMHYGKNEFAQPGKITMVTSNSSVLLYFTGYLDKQTSFCGTLKQVGNLDCSYDHDKKFCCATCNAVIPRESINPGGS